MFISHILLIIALYFRWYKTVSQIRLEYSLVVGSQAVSVSVTVCSVFKTLTRLSVVLTRVSCGQQASEAESFMTRPPPSVLMTDPPTSHGELSHMGLSSLYNVMYTCPLVRLMCEHLTKMYSEQNLLIRH